MTPVAEMEREVEKKILTPVEQLRQNIANDPGKFAKKLFGVRLWPKQAEIVSSIFNHKRVAVRGCVASTKTFGAAIAMYAWLIAYPKTGRVFHLAPSFRQVQTNAFGYLKALDHKATENGSPLGAKIFSEPRIEFGGSAWGYQGFNTKDPQALHGIHGPNDLIVLDDAHGIPKEITDELENITAGGKTVILMLFNPVTLSGETFECTHKQKAIWHNIKIDFNDLKKAYAEGYEMTGSLQQEAVTLWANKYGVKSNFFLPKVLGEYPQQASDTLIPMDHIEQAMSREVPDSPSEVLGVDVAWAGDDTSVIARMKGRKILDLEQYSGTDPMELADKVDRYLADGKATAFIDSIGIGAGVYSREKQRERKVHAFIASESAIGKHEGKEASDHFQNLRAQAAWALREALDPKNPLAIALPRDSDLQAEMAAITYRTNSTTGKIQLMPKEEMKKALGYSPDRFDAVVMANWGQCGKAVTSIPWSDWI